MASTFGTSGGARSPASLIAHAGRHLFAPAHGIQGWHGSSTFVVVVLVGLGFFAALAGIAGLGVRQATLREAGATTTATRPRKVSIRALDMRLRADTVVLVDAIRSRDGDRIFAAKVQLGDDVAAAEAVLRQDRPRPETRPTSAAARTRAAIGYLRPGMEATDVAQLERGSSFLDLALNMAMVLAASTG